MNRVALTCPLCQWHVEAPLIEDGSPRPTAAGRGPMTTHMRQAHGWDMWDLFEWLCQMMMGDPILTPEEQAAIRASIRGLHSAS